MSGAQWLLLALQALTLVSGTQGNTTEPSPDVTLVLRPHHDTDWTQLRQWFKQHRFPTQSLQTEELHSHPKDAGPPNPVSSLRLPGGSPSTTSTGPPQSARTRVQPGPALVPDSTHSKPGRVRSGPALATDSSPSGVQPGPALVPASTHSTPGRLRPALVTDSTSERMQPGPPLVVDPTHARIQPGPALVPDSTRARVQPRPELVLFEPVALPLVAPSRPAADHQQATSDHSLDPARSGKQPAQPRQRTGELLFRLEPIVGVVPPQHVKQSGSQAETDPAVGQDSVSGRQSQAEADPADGQESVSGRQSATGEPTDNSEGTTLSSGATEDAGPTVGYPAGDYSRNSPGDYDGGTPAGDYSGGSLVSGYGGSQMAPDVLATLLQRLEDRLVVSEALQRQQAAEMRTVQHSQRKEEVTLGEQREDVRTQFDNLEHKVSNLQSDINRVSVLAESVLGEVRSVSRRQQRQQQLTQPTTSSADGEQALQTAVSGLTRALAKVATTTELMRAGQRQITGTLRKLTNTTRELEEGAKQCATVETVAGSVAEIKNYLDQHQSAQPVRQPAEGEDRLPADCSEVQLRGDSPVSGVHHVWPRGALLPILVFCDLDTDGGGWAVIQRRSSGEQDFYQDWIAYKYGFGSLTDEFWLGNEHIHDLTNHRRNSLRVELADFPREQPGFAAYRGSNATASYANFALGSEMEGYAIRLLDGYSGDAGDSLQYHAGVQFSTKDRDHDHWDEDSCARNHKGGWWYKGCDSSNLNGLYLSGPVPAEYQYQGVYWHDWRGPRYSLYRTRMMVRPDDHRRRMQQQARARGREEEAISPQPTVRKSKRRRNRRRKGRRHD